MTTNQDAWTILRLLEWGSDYLADKAIDSPRLTVELLLAHVLGCDRLRLYLNHDKPLDPRELQGFKTLLKRRLAHEPVQYITGTANFMGIELSVNEHVLIPRPETEQLTEQGLELIDTLNSDPCHVLDIGTGSGCIAIAIARFRAGCIVDAIDISNKALEVASVNVFRYDLQSRVVLWQDDVLSPSETLLQRRYDLVVANPPYVSAAEQEQLPPEIRLHEPAIAITDGGDGLSFYRSISSLGTKIVRKGGALCMEVGYNQSVSVADILRGGGYTPVSVRNDYAGIGRIITAFHP